MVAATPLDTTTEVVTPENIAFEYQLAGPFRRLPAYLLDVMVYTCALLLLILIAILIGFASSSMLAVSIWGFIALVIWFVLGWFYGALCETFFNGRTIGKWACGLRVISIDGRPLSGMQATIRNLLRVADMAPYAALGQWEFEMAPIMNIPTALVGLIAVIATKRMQRLGDLAAGTMVVVDEKSWRLPVAKVDDARVPALASFFPGDYRVTPTMARTLAAYAERRSYLTPSRRREIARHLTDPLIDRFEFRHDIDPDLLLYALYFKTFLEADQNEAVALGALAGFSPLRKDQQPTDSGETS
ncbi:RDD family protein [Roseimaritima multifibrata]|uniref:RDD family protein n=1 Tax=Roseimaritima multifibrata TaxID=1930274 RepID=A0A517MIT0_9BACT|nr:RDD family protein [Roseimaritima multifibrata]QDS94796.1 RDD family protein [Roseimaritima multifibrata]